MTRWLFVALLTPVLAAAQAPAKAPFPLEFSGGTPGVSIEIFLNAGKVGDVTLDAGGAGNWLLDIGNLGKTRVDTYVDVCKDGKIVKVLVVSGGGQAPPEDEGCNRRIVAVSFQSDCGVLRINFDFRRFAARIIGCTAPIYTRPAFYGPIGGVIVALPFIMGGDPTATAPAAGTPPATTGAPPPPSTATPPATTPPSTTPPSTTPAPPSTPPRTTANGRYRCIAAAVVSDPGRHNPTINLGPQLTGDFTVTEGSITIRHPAPFVDVVNAQFDTASGRFSGDTRGTVAGFPNVGVRASGTVDTNTGRMEFDYTMGTGGELPGGQPITYRITLQRQ